MIQCSKGMAPAFRQELCALLCNISVSCTNSSTSPGTEAYNEKDKNALLYIVCTLLFYSLGIMIGIVSYIKREKRDIEQDRMFDDFLNSFSGKTEVKHYRKIQVQDTIDRLAEIDKKNRAEHKCSNTDKTGAKPSGESKRFYKFVTLSVMQSPLSIKTKLTLKSESKLPKQSHDKALGEVSKEVQNVEPSKQCSEVTQNDHHLNGEACNIDVSNDVLNEETTKSNDYEQSDDNNKDNEPNEGAALNEI